MKDLIRLEEEGWQALATAGEAGRNFYQTVLHDDAIMLFPGGLRLEGKTDILDSLAAQSWQSFQIEEPQLLPLAEDVAVVIYKVEAQRDGDEPYAAVISSTYICRDGEWKLRLHQQSAKA
jgi:hypothetical protein